MIRRSSSTSREEWFNRVQLIHRWRDGSTDHEIQSVRSLTLGERAAVAGNVKTYTEERDTPATQARADTSAASLLARMASRGRGVEVRAIAVPWLRPGMTVSLSTRTGTARHLVSRIEFDAAGWMVFSTRYPDSTETIGA